MKINKARIVLSLATLCCATSSVLFAATESFPTNTSNNFSFLSPLAHGHLVFEAGAYQALAQGNTQHINIQDLVGNTYTVTDTTSTSGLIGLGYFIDGNDIRRFAMSYGINAFYLAPTSVSGNVIQEDLFTNLSYHYNITNLPVYIMAKSSMWLNSSLALSVDVGLGPNFMKVSDYRETPLDPVSLPDNMYSSNTTTNFSGTVGVSLKMSDVLGRLPLEIGYRYFYLGEGHFKNSNNQVQNNFKTGNSYANAIIISLAL